MPAGNEKRDNALFGGSRLPVLFLVNGTLLLIHEIDSAYWHEWELFGLPGGIQVFLILNVPIILLVLYGYGRILMGRPDGRLFSWILVFGGLFAAVLHGGFLAAGNPAFRNPVSMTLLAGILAISALQGIATLRWRARGA